MGNWKLERISRPERVLKSAVISIAVGVASLSSNLTTNSTCAQQPKDFNSGPLTSGILAPKRLVPESESRSESIQTARVDSKDENEAPTIVVRPSINDADQLSHCVVELNKEPDSNGYSLKLTVPDSVSNIEVVPNRDSGSYRNFRLRLDQGNSPIETEPLAQPIKPAITPAETTITQLPQLPPAPAPAYIPRAGFQLNPFFDPNIAVTKKAAKEPTQKDKAPTQPPQMAEQVTLVNRPKPEAIDNTVKTLKQVNYSNTETATTVSTIPNVASEAISNPKPAILLDLIASAKSNLPKKAVSNESPATPENIAVPSLPEAATPTLKKESEEIIARPKFNIPVVANVLIEPASDSQTTRGDSLDPESTSKTIEPVATKTPESLVAEIFGPSDSELGTQSDFSVAIVNPTAKDWKNIDVKLSVPAGMEIVVLDRHAMVNSDKSTIVWNIDEIKRDAEVVIQYRVKSTQSGNQNQIAEIKVNNKPHKSCELKTHVH